MSFKLICKTLVLFIQCMYKHVDFSVWLTETTFLQKTFYEQMSGLGHCKTCYTNIFLIGQDVHPLHDLYAHFKHELISCNLQHMYSFLYFYSTVMHCIEKLSLISWVCIYVKFYAIYSSCPVYHFCFTYN